MKTEKALTADSPIELLWTADNSEEINEWLEMAAKADDVVRIEPRIQNSNYEGWHQYVRIPTTLGKALKYYGYVPQSLLENYFPEDDWTDLEPMMDKFVATL